jgi:hypothetical protein
MIIDLLNILASFHNLTDQSRVFVRHEALRISSTKAPRRSHRGCRSSCSFFSAEATRHMRAILWVLSRSPCKVKAAIIDSEGHIDITLQMNSEQFVWFCGMFFDMTWNHGENLSGMAVAGEVQKHYERCINN